MRKDKVQALKHTQRIYANAVPIFHILGIAGIIIGGMLVMNNIGSALAMSLTKHSSPIFSTVLTSPMTYVGAILIIIGIDAFKYGLKILPQQYQSNLHNMAKPSLITVLVAEISRPFYNMFKF